MKISFTKKEYRLLVDMLYLSDWIMNSHHNSPEQHHKEHQLLRKKLLSYYQEMDAEDLIEYSNEFDDYYEQREYDNKLNDLFIEPYNNEIFWEELLSRLAERDLIRKMGIEDYKTMAGIDRMVQLARIKEKYALEFENHGLNRIKIIS